MTRLHLLLLPLLLLAIVVFSAVFFVLPGGSGEAQALPALSALDSPQIVTDKVNNVVRVLISGKEVLTINASGIHVNGDVAYTGGTIDTETSP